MRNANTYAHWFAKCYGDRYCNWDRNSSEYEANTNAASCSNRRSTAYAAPSSNATADTVFAASNTGAAALANSVTICLAAIVGAKSTQLLCANGLRLSKHPPIQKEP